MGGTTHLRFIWPSPGEASEALHLKETCQHFLVSFDVPLKLTARHTAGHINTAQLAQDTLCPPVAKGD